MEHTILMTNSKGAYVPAIPLPYYRRLRFRRRVRFGCHCGAEFKHHDDYRGHYALRHILEV